MTLTGQRTLNGCGLVLASAIAQRISGVTTFFETVNKRLDLLADVLAVVLCGANHLESLPIGQAA
jgi:hypothetical protein